MPAPSVQSIVRTGLRYHYGELQFRDFSGGLNIRDAAPELGAIISGDDLFPSFDASAPPSRSLLSPLQACRATKPIEAAPMAISA